jgi:hypothetical protein
MKILMKTLLLGAMVGLMAPAALAEDFVVDHDRYEKHQASKTHYNKAEPSSGFKKGVYSGSSAYAGNLTGRVAVQTDRIGDMDGRAFTVHPVRGSGHEFNATLRYGDSSQSRSYHGKHVFNN